MNTKFKRDLATGERFEDQVLQLFSKKHKAYKVCGYHKAFDLVCECCGTTIECKYEPIAEKTGNFFFSFPLVNNSEADILFEGTGKHIYWCRMDELRYWLDMMVRRGICVERVGNEGEHGYVMPIKEATSFMNRVN